jgi:hypothetical protein
MLSFFTNKEAPAVAAAFSTGPLVASTDGGAMFAVLLPLIRMAVQQLVRTKKY